MGMQKGASIVGGGEAWCFLEKLNTELTIWSSTLTSGYIPKRIESKFPKEYLYVRVHSSIIYNSQEVEAILGSMDK